MPVCSVVLALLLSVPGGEATEQFGTEPEQRTSEVPTLSRAGEPSLDRSTATDNKVEKLGGLEFSLPASWQSAAVSVTSVAPLPDTVGAPPSTNVSVTFSEEMDPTTVTVVSFRLLDPDLSPVPAQVALGPNGIQATLDPIAALGFNLLYTVELTDDVQSALGQALLPFTSQFSTRK